MGSGSLGQRARLETAEVCSREELERLDCRDTEREMWFEAVQVRHWQRRKKKKNLSDLLFHILDLYSQDLKPKF